MRADEYLRLQMACVAMARQSQLPDVQARWAKLADAAAFVADAAALELKIIYRTDRQATQARRSQPVARHLAAPGGRRCLIRPIIASGPTAPAHACCWRPA